MSYTTGFMTAGVLAAVLTWSAGASAAEAAAEEDAAAGHARPPAPLSGRDVAALEALSAALGKLAVPRRELTAPDDRLAAHAGSAADRATGRTRETLLCLAEAAQRNVLEFLVDYSLAAGEWEAASGLRMSSPMLVSELELH